ncbi:hypothetical protein GCM10023184_05970 [Flaviaesturariibacter amylovorans]|uniref:Glycine zipper family protein n=2 Tax=Flaviaesturariibacter amylovorans TaxID=1084520 RepID=A0ABP8GB78_9BACT
MLFAVATVKAQEEVQLSDDQIIKVTEPVGFLHNQGLDYIYEQLRSSYGEVFPPTKPKEGRPKLYSILDGATLSFAKSTFNSDELDHSRFINGDMTGLIATHAEVPLADLFKVADPEHKLSGEFYEAVTALDGLMQDVDRNQMRCAYDELVKEKIGTLKSYDEKLAWGSAVSIAYHSLAYWEKNRDKWQNFFGSGSKTATARKPAKDIAKADVAGIVTGGISGCAYGAVGGTVTMPGIGTVAGCAGGAAVGAVAGGLGSSAKKAAEAFVDWLFGD